jgi:hypothetical protein
MPKTLALLHGPQRKPPLARAPSHPLQVHLFHVISPGQHLVLANPDYGIDNVVEDDDETKRKVRWRGASELRRKRR